jgi:transposase-like protein
MGQVFHGSATKTEAVRRAIQHSQASLRALAKRYGINQKTVAKWKGRTSVADLATGPKKPKSTVLTKALSDEREDLSCEVPLQCSNGGRFVDPHSE